MVVHHEKVQLLFAVFFADCGEQHAAGLNARHGTGRKVGDGD